MQVRERMIGWWARGEQDAVKLGQIILNNKDTKAIRESIERKYKERWL